MSEEEKKAMEILKEIKDVRGIRQDVEGENEDLCALDIVYNLVEKLQKEIKELKMKKEEKIQNYYNMLREFYYEKNGLEATIDFLAQMIEYLKEEKENEMQ